MKLVETEVEHGDEDVPEVPRPPRPEHRRVHVSLFLTFSILVGTVAAIYLVFPDRHNELLTVAVEAHRSGDDFELDQPTWGELRAWSLGVLGEKAPFPDGDLVPLGARRLTILRRPAVLARYRAGDDAITVLLTRARDAPPRRYERRDGDLAAASWRRGAWTVVAIGPAESSDSWRRLAGAP